MVRLGMAWQGEAGFGVVWNGLALRCSAGFGRARQGGAWVKVGWLAVISVRGADTYAWFGSAWQGEAWQGVAGLGNVVGRGQAGRGLAVLGMVRQGMGSWQPSRFEALMSTKGLARLGEAWQGAARYGLAGWGGVREWVTGSLRGSRPRHPRKAR